MAFRFNNSVLKIALTAICLTVVFGCSNANRPTKDELISSLSEGLAERLSEKMEVKSFSIETDEDAGSEVEPLYQTRFTAQVAFEKSRYNEVSKKHGAIIVEKILDKDKSIKIYGVSTSVLSGPKWATTFKIENLEDIQKGSVLDNFKGNVLVLDSPGYNDFMGEIGAITSELNDNQLLINLAKNYYDNVGYKGSYYIEMIQSTTIDVLSATEVKSKVIYRYKSVNGRQSGADARFFYLSKSSGKWVVTNMARR